MEQLPNMIERKSNIAEVIIPFSGFYDSIHSEIMHDETLNTIAYRLFDMDLDELMDDDLEKVQDLLWMQSSDYWDKYRHNYSVAYAKEWCHQTTIKFHSFGEISSPREYNFSTDRLFVWCEFKSLQRLRIEHLDEFKVWAISNIHSKDGFVLFSEYSPENWIYKPCRTWDANMWGIFLDYLEEQHLGDISYSVYEELWGSGIIANCLPEDELNLIDKCNCGE